MQITLDHVPATPTLADLVFFGVFEWDGLLGLGAGTVAILTGWRRRDATVLFGITAIVWVVLAQTTQSLWD